MGPHILLIGFMGAGKTTVARMVAEQLNMPVIDLDQKIESEQNMTIAEIFDNRGEEAFRELEARALASLADAVPSVVACGGGVVLADENRAMLSRLGFAVYLAVSTGEMLARVGADPTRPLLRKGALDAGRLLASRESLYTAAADMRIDTVGLTPAEVAEQVVAAVVDRKEAAAGGLARERVDTPSGGYEVFIGPGLLGQAGLLLAEASHARRVALISDDTVSDLFGERATMSIAAAGFEVIRLEFPAGEASKTWERAGELLEALAAAGLSRTDLVVALGGGVVGDLAGFVAATYLRGVALAQIPTTLLAQVDSSVGGKTGVDLRAGKNLAGAFKQPIVVIADTSLLATLPHDEWASGLAEVAKSAIIDSEEFTGWLEHNGDALLNRDEQVVAEAVRRCVAFKARVVSGDERESGERECLNYGHTFGHALENVAGYGSIPHGIAVAEGMRFAARIAADVAGAPSDFTKRQQALLGRLIPPFPQRVYAVEELMDAMHSDKKAREGRVRFVLATRPGKWRCEPVDEEIIREHLTKWEETARTAAGADRASG